MLYAALQIRYPELRSVLFTGVQTAAAVPLTRALAEVVAASGRAVVLGVPGEGVAAATSPQPYRVADLTNVNCLLDVAVVRDLVAHCAEHALALFATQDLMSRVESHILASSVDGVVIVARHSRTRARTLRQAGSLLERHGARLIGSVCVEGESV